VPRLRLGVALLVPPPVGAEVDGLRRAAGDGALGRIPPHCTLVPPVNVREDRLSDALAHLRDAGSTTRPFRVELGPVETFLPDSPVLYLAVGGDGFEALLDLRDRVFSEPLSRPVTWPFVPHVTLAEEMEARRIDASIRAFANYRAEVTFERVHLLEEGEGRVWSPIADVAFAGYVALLVRARAIADERSMKVRYLPGPVPAPLRMQHAESALRSAAR